jgi:hypothetical protein
MNFREKIVSNKQKQNLTQMHEQISKRNLDYSILRQILYPESSNILESVLANINNGVWEKAFYAWPSQDCEDQLTFFLKRLRTSEKTLLCFFPNYSPREDSIASDLPVLEVAEEKIDEWYELARSQGLHFFLCTSEDLRRGIALDVYEADSVVHGTAGAVCGLHFWNV